MYVYFGTLIWSWTTSAHGFVLPIGMVVKSAVELIYYRSFLGVRKNVNDEFYAGRSQLRIQEPRKKTLTFLVPKWTLWLVRWMKGQVSRSTWTVKAPVFYRPFPFVMLRRELKLSNRTITRSIGSWIESDWRGKGQDRKSKRGVD